MRIQLKFLLVVATILLLSDAAGASESLPPASPGKSWKLVWRDEFDGQEIDKSKWNVITDSPRGEGFWSDDNVALDGDGHIVFKATQRGDKVVGAGMDTYGKFAATGGFFTFRCKLSPHPGYRPAIWITSKSVNEVGNEGRDGTEIDVMEQPSRSDEVYLNLHWDGYGEGHRTTGVKSKIKGALNDWHVFSVLWAPTGYTFFVDGEKAWETQDGGVSQVDEVIKIGIEVPWPLARYRDYEFSGEDVFVCDYARVYKEER